MTGRRAPSAGRYPSASRHHRSPVRPFVSGARQRRTRFIKHLVFPSVLLLAVFVVTSFAVARDGHDQRVLVRRYLGDWKNGDYQAMYRLLAPSDRGRVTEPTFAADYAAAAQTATITSLHCAHAVDVHGQLATDAMVVHTRLFGTIRATVDVALDHDRLHVDFRPQMVFPGLRRGEQLHRQTQLAARGTLLAANGQALAQGPYLVSPIPAVAQQIVGSLASVRSLSSSQRTYYTNLGYPQDAQVGHDGLELVFQNELAGRPGGVLYEGSRKIAHAAPVPGKTVRTTIVPSLEREAMKAVGDKVAGLTAINPHTGAIEAAVGLAFTDVQPPGSTFKIITSTALLHYGVARLSSTYPQVSSTVIDGYRMQNAAGEVCGGTLINAFAVSCDTTFAPLGARLGAQRLVSTAMLYGFDRPTGIPSALESTLPSAQTIGDAIAVGSSAIGQGKVLASTLEMADVAATIANGGERPLPTFNAAATPRYVHVTTPTIAGEIQQMMEAVVQYGTGTTAQIPGVKVAGKTGTAELANTANNANDTAETDGWFVAYAPAGNAKIAVSALFPNQGYGEATAAPAVKEVIEAALAMHAS